MLKNILISLFLGLTYVAIPIAMYPTGNYYIQSILLILLPLPMLLGIFFFSFWVTLLSFAPSVIMIISNLSASISVSVVITIPLLIIFCFINIVRNNVGKYIPILLSLYPIIVLISIDAYFNKNNLSLINYILDNVHSLIIQINSFSPEVIKNYNSNFLIKFISFIMPTGIAFCFYILLSVNYVLATYIAKINKVNVERIRIGYDLPKYYVHFFISVLVVTLITYYVIKNNWHILYIMYNIATILFIPFLVSGFGVINFLRTKYKGFIFLFIILLFVLQLYLIIMLCFLGFLKEAKLFTYSKDLINN